jgi:hypothetical protein
MWMWMWWMLCLAASNWLLVWVAFPGIIDWGIKRVTGCDEGWARGTCFLGMRIENEKGNERKRVRCA